MEKCDEERKWRKFEGGERDCIEEEEREHVRIQLGIQKKGQGG